MEQTKSLRSAISLASKIAAIGNRREISCGDLLYGILATPAVGYHVVVENGVDPSEIADRVLRQLGISRWSVVIDFFRDFFKRFFVSQHQANFSIEAKQLLALAEAMAMQFPFRYLGTEHVLLAFTHQENAWSEILREAGITRENTKNAIKSLLGLPM